MPKKQNNRLSVAIRVAVDEIATSLLTHVPEETVAKILTSSCDRAVKRLQTNKVGKRPRDSVYDAKYLHRLIVRRLTDPPGDLAAIVGLKDGKQIEIPDMGTEPEAVPEAPPEDFGSWVLPKFEDYEEVFDKWPYVMERTNDDGRVIVFGYGSFRDKNNKLVHRNVAYYRPEDDFTSKGAVAKKIASAEGLLTGRRGNFHQFIKVLPYKPGARLRFWTHRQGERDLESHYRYVVLGVDGLHAVSQVGMETFPRDGRPPKSPPAKASALN